MPELDSPKVNRDIGPKIDVALGEFCDRDSEGDEGGERDVANGDLGVFLLLRGELINETVAVVIDEETTGDIVLGEELAGDVVGEEEIAVTTGEMKGFAEDNADLKSLIDTL